LAAVWADIQRVGDVVTNQGTLALGRTNFSHAIWTAAESRQETVAA
jgi:hypothetical protein